MGRWRHSRRRTGLLESSLNHLGLARFGMSCDELDSSVSVQLRPVRRQDLPWMVQMMTNRELVGSHNWSGEMPDPDELNRHFSHRLDIDGFISRQSGRLVVELTDGRAVGDVTWRSERWGPSPKSRCLAFGIALLPPHRGHGYGTEAQRLLIDYLFDLDQELNRIQSDTAIDNVAERRSLQKIGMIEEGRIREAEFRDGQYHDHIVYGILRSEWQALAETTR